jgi:hypothetical protein
VLRSEDIESALYNIDRYGQHVVTLPLKRWTQSGSAPALRKAVSGKGGQGQGGEKGGKEGEGSKADESMSSDACLELADFRDAWQVALRSVLDVMVFALMVAWLTFKAWQENKFFSATLDTDQDLNVSWHEISMYIYRNVGSILNSLIVLLLVTAAAVRLSQRHGWASLPCLEATISENSPIH